MYLKTPYYTPTPYEIRQENIKQIVKQYNLVKINQIDLEIFYYDPKNKKIYKVSCIGPLVPYFELQN
jgi:hypothetical protein